MKRLVQIMMVLLFAATLTGLAEASGYDKGSMKGSVYESKGSADKGSMMEGISKYDKVRAAMADYIERNVEEVGTFDVEDPETGKFREMEFVEFHKGVKENKGVFTVCADFKDLETGDIIDVDFDVEDVAGSMFVVDVRFHKIIEEGMKGSGKGSMKGSAHEHKGSEYEQKHKGSDYEHKGSW